MLLWSIVLVAALVIVGLGASILVFSEEDKMARVVASILILVGVITIAICVVLDLYFYTNL